MSCGHPDDADCSEVLAEVWLFLDNECNQERRALLKRHLDECGSCLEKYGLEEHLKALLARKCGGDHAPDAFKQRLRQSIKEIMLRQAVLGAEVTVGQDEDGTVVEVRTSDVRTSDVRTSDVRTNDVRTNDVRTSDVRITEVRTTMETHAWVSREP